MVEWVSLLKESLAAEYGQRPPVAALATVDAEGRARVRHVVCRGVDERGNLWAASDARSAKNAQLRENPNAEIALYLPTLRRQFRLSGVMQRMQDPAIRAAWWSQLPDATQAMFFWPEPGARRVGGPHAFPQTPPA